MADDENVPQSLINFDKKEPEPYPYFYQSWNKQLLCNLGMVEQIYDINKDAYDEESIAIYNQMMEGEQHNFEEQHAKYANSLQNYYTLVSQTADLPAISSPPASGETTGEVSGSDASIQAESDKISILDLTPILVQNCRDIKQTECFKLLDQGHDLRGSRTSGGGSWLSAFSNGLIKRQGDDKNYSNEFINGVVNTTISGKYNIVGFLVIPDSSHKVWLENGFGKQDGSQDRSVDVSKIMAEFSNVKCEYKGGNVHMRCNSQGDRLKMEFSGTSASACFFGFPSDGWDSTGAHYMWSMMSQKHVYVVTLDTINIDEQQETFGGYKYTTIETIVRLNEIFFTTIPRKHSSRSDIQTIIGDDETPETINAMTGEDLSSELPKTFLRGAVYRFYGVNSIDKSKRSKACENAFLKLLRIVGNQASPEIDPSYKLSDSLLNGKIGVINERYKRYNALDPENNSEDFIEQHCLKKQIGTVNDMNISPTIERIMDAINNDDSQTEEKGEGQGEMGEGQGQGQGQGQGEGEGQEISICQQQIDEALSDKIKLDKKYPYKFQVVSGVLDSSGLGGQNIPQYFPPQIDIYMTIFEPDSEQMVGAIVRLIFLKEVLKNATNQKNNSSVHSHFVYVGFDEIGFEQDTTDYPTALEALLKYVTENTYYVSKPVIKDPVSSLIIRLLRSTREQETGDDISDSESVSTQTDSTKIERKWYYYLADTTGPSVKEGIDNVVKKIMSGRMPYILDENSNISESILRVAQRIYIDSNTLQEIYPSEEGDTLSVPRNFVFESLFLSENKAIGDDGRVGDPLTLNRNKFLECFQVTGDQNAYFKALMSGASTFFSTKSHFSMYFAPYYTYEVSGSEGKFLINKPIWKKELLQGQSPTAFKIDSKTKMTKIFDISEITVFESKQLSELGFLIKDSIVTIERHLEDLMILLVNLEQLLKGDNADQLQKFLDDGTLSHVDLLKIKSSAKAYRKECKNILDEYNEFIDKIKGATEWNKKYKKKDLVGLLNEKNQIWTNPDIQSAFSRLVNMMDKTTSSVEEKEGGEPSEEKLAITKVDDILPELEEFRAYVKRIQANIGDNPPKAKQARIDNLIVDLDNLIEQSKEIKENDEISTTDYIKSVRKFLAVFKGSIKKPDGIIFPAKIEEMVESILEFIDLNNNLVPALNYLKYLFIPQMKLCNDKSSIIDRILVMDKSLLPEPEAKAEAQAPAEPEAEAPAEPEAEPEAEAKAAAEAEAKNSTMKCLPGQPCALLGGAGSEEDSYKTSQLNTLSNFAAIIASVNEDYKKFVNGLTFNYDEITSIQDVCIAVSVLQGQYALTGYTPKISIENVVEYLNPKEPQTMTLEEIIGLREFYAPIIDIYTDIGYTSVDPVQSIMSTVQLTQQEGVISDLEKWRETCFNVTNFIYWKMMMLNNLNMVSEDALVSEDAARTYQSLTTLYTLLKRADSYTVTSIYGVTAENIEDSSLEPKAKNILTMKLQNLKSFEKMSLFFIKYCDAFIKKLGFLTETTDGIIINYGEIKNVLSKDPELLTYFEGLNVVINDSNSQARNLLENFEFKRSDRNNWTPINKYLADMFTALSEIVSQITTPISIPNPNPNPTLSELDAPTKTSILVPLSPSPGPSTTGSSLISTKPSNSESGGSKKRSVNKKNKKTLRKKAFNKTKTRKFKRARKKKYTVNFRK